MTSLPIESNTAANDAPVSIASDVETEEEDLEQIQRDAAAAQTETHGWDPGPVKITRQKLFQSSEKRLYILWV